MNVHHVEATLTQNGTLTLRDLPFHAGDAVEVIISPRLTKPPPVEEKEGRRRKARERERPQQKTAPFPLRGSLELGCSPKELEEEMRRIRGMWAETPPIGLPPKMLMPDPYRCRLRLDPHQRQQCRRVRQDG